MNVAKRKSNRPKHTISPSLFYKWFPSDKTSKKDITYSTNLPNVFVDHFTHYTISDYYGIKSS